jgi:hypothetical protein
MGYNMHAAEDISKGETIMIIPPAAVIDSDGTEEECVTVNKMMKEYAKGPDSDYYPYIRYLFGGHEGGTSAGLLPSTWSQPAKDLLKTILGSDLYPKKFEKGQRKVLSFCKEYIDAKDIQNIDKETHQRWQDAYIFWLSRSWTDKMVPILDMINHRNGKWLNVESTTAHSGEDIRVYALRDIGKGEQLWSTSRQMHLFFCPRERNSDLCSCEGYVSQSFDVKFLFLSSSQIPTMNAWILIVMKVESSTRTSLNTFWRIMVLWRPIRDGLSLM